MAIKQMDSPCDSDLPGHSGGRKRTIATFVRRIFKAVNFEKFANCRTVKYHGIRVTWPSNRWIFRGILTSQVIQAGRK
jgi:hypothetical protein